MDLIINILFIYLISFQVICVLLLLGSVIFLTLGLSKFYYEKYTLIRDLKKLEGKTFLINTDWQLKEDFQNIIYPTISKEIDYFYGFFPEERKIILSKKLFTYLYIKGDVSGQDRGPYLIMIYKGKAVSYSRFSINFGYNMSIKNIIEYIRHFKKEIDVYSKRYYRNP